MEALPQPPPGIPIPQCRQKAALSRRWRKAILFLGLLSIGSLGGGILLASFTDTFRVRRCHSPRMKALSAARQVGLALFDFDSDYSSFPDASTWTMVKEATGSSEPASTATSNDFFRQLFIAGIVTDESIFHAMAPGTRRPDGITGGGRTLEKGECVFSYVEGGASTHPSDRPVIVAPLLPGKLLFDEEAFEGYAVVLRNDNSVASFPIDKSGHVILPNGMDLFDPGQAYWDGTTPVVKWPDLFPVSKPLPGVPFLKSSIQFALRFDVLAWSVILAVLGTSGAGTVMWIRRQPAYGGSRRLSRQLHKAS